MQIAVRNRCSDFNSYRAARVKSLLNAESGCNFDPDAGLDIDDRDWQIGVVVGPSGSGKTSIGRRIFGAGEAAFWLPQWPADGPIIDAIAPEGDFDAVTGALAAVGLDSVPTWLRPYPILPNGEKFRADLARLVCEQPTFGQVPARDVCRNNEGSRILAIELFKPRLDPQPYGAGSASSRCNAAPVHCIARRRGRTGALAICCIQNPDANHCVL